jgi:hypothetical protein
MFTNMVLGQIPTLGSNPSKTKFKPHRILDLIAVIYRVLKIFHKYFKIDQYKSCLLSPGTHFI